MNIGKVPENVLKRSILKKIETRRSEVLLGAGVGEDCAVLALKEDEVFILSTDPITGTTKDDIRKLELLMNQAEITIEDRRVVGAALEKEKLTGHPAAAIELPDGTLITGKTGDLLGPSAAMILNAIKTLAGIDDEIKLIAPEFITPIQTLKTDYLGSSNPNLHMDEILIALSSSAGSNDLAAQALKQLPRLRGCDAHSTVILSAPDISTYRRLGIQLTCEPKYEEEDRLYHKQ